MKLENIVKLVVPAVFAANTAFANEAQVATTEQVTAMVQTNDNATFSSKENAEDWYHQKKIIESGKATVLIQPSKSNPGFCEYGLDGFPQVYDEKYKDKRTENQKIEPAEMILNGTNNTFLFPCDLKATYTPNLVLVPGPAEIIEKEVPSVLVSAGAGYVQLFAEEDEKYDFNGILQGGKAFITFQPRGMNWYFGGEAMLYGNSSSTTEDITAPATEGPLAGQLVMQGKNDYSLETVGFGVGSIIGYMIPIDKKERFGVGLELEHGFMHDWITRKFGESSAHYIKSVDQNGEPVYTIVEGTNISNHSDNNDTQFYGYGMGGLRLKLPYVCGTISGGFRTDFSNVDGMLSAGVAYCPNKE